MINDILNPDTLQTVLLHTGIKTLCTKVSVCSKAWKKAADETLAGCKKLSNIVPARGCQGEFCFGPSSWQVQDGYFGDDMSVAVFKYALSVEEQGEEG